MADIKTYMWQEQPYISWKGAGTLNALPAGTVSWSRPASNGSWPLYEGARRGPAAPRYSASGSRPLKIWRKRLVPTRSSGGGRPGIGMPSDKPGGAPILVSKAGFEPGTLNGNTCCSGKSNQAYSPSQAATFYYNVKPLNPDFSAPSKSDKFLDPNQQATCIACNPENNVIRRATTVLSKKYYTDSRAYLRARGRRYTQNLGTGSRLPNVRYEQAGDVLYPSDNPKLGPPRYLTADCACQSSPQSPAINGPPPNAFDSSTAISNYQRAAQQPTTGKTLIYKPNNRKFMVQGAVESSTRLDRLKLETINNAAASQRQAWGNADVQASRYSARSAAPVRLKSKYYRCTGGACFNPRLSSPRPIQP